MCKHSFVPSLITIIFVQISSSNKELNQLVDSQEMEDYLIESGGRDIPFRVSLIV